MNFYGFRAEFQMTARYAGAPRAPRERRAALTARQVLIERRAEELLGGAHL